MVTRVIILQILGECDDSCSPTLCGGYVNSQVAQIAYKGGGEATPAAPATASATAGGVVVVVIALGRLPLRLLLVEPPFGFRIQLLLIPHLACAALPPRAALVAELGAAPARHVVAPKRELDDCATAWTPLPAVLLEEVVDHGGAVVDVVVIVWDARRVPWMGGLLAVRAEETVAGRARHLAIECLHGSEECGTHWP